jgi:hypothetical protein
MRGVDSNLARPTNLIRLVTRAVPCVLLAVALAPAGCGHVGVDNAVTGKSIRYQVEYFGSPQTGLANRAVIISYSTTEGIKEQHNVGLPWTFAVGTVPAGFSASVKAQFYGYGTVVCRILADDELVVNATSREEPYPTVECRV